MSWQSTGFTAEVPGSVHGREMPAFDPRTGDHLWNWIAVYRATPGVERPILDMETLLTIEGMGCYHCEQPYTPQLAQRRCKGKP